MKITTFTGKESKDNLNDLLTKNKNKIVSMFQDAFGADSPYKEDRSNPADIMSAMTVPLDKNGSLIVGKIDDDIVGITTIYPLLVDDKKDDLIALLCADFDIPIEKFIDEKVIYACDTFVDKNAKRKGIGTELYQERLKISKERGYEYFVGTTSSEESNTIALAYHKKNGMSFSAKGYKIASAYSDAIRCLMLQKL